MIPTPRSLARRCPRARRRWGGYPNAEGGGLRPRAGLRGVSAACTIGRMDQAPTTGGPAGRGLLGFLERAGNRLPDPATLFIVGAVVVMLLSQIGAAQGWEVQKPTVVRAVVDGKE